MRQTVQPGARQAAKTAEPVSSQTAHLKTAEPGGRMAQLAAMMNAGPQVQPLAQLKDAASQGCRMQNLMGLAAEINQGVRPDSSMESEADRSGAGEVALQRQQAAGSSDESSIGSNGTAQLKIDIFGTLAQGDRSRDEHADAHAYDHAGQPKSDCGCGAKQDKTSGKKQKDPPRGKQPLQKKPMAQKPSDASQATTQMENVSQRKRANPGGDTVQLFPYKKKNDKTNRAFLITNDGSQLVATQIAGDKDDPHSGYATYTVRKDAVELGHIQSDPEEGSGIGSLLMYYLAHLALLKGKMQITIPTAAPTAVGFYELLGFTPANLQGAAQFEAMISQNPDEIEKAENLYFQTRAKIEYDTDPENRKLKSKGFLSSEKERRQFGKLPSGEQQKLILKQKDAFGKKSTQDQAKIRTTMLHGKAVAMTGMVGNTHTVMDKSNALLGRWSDFESSVWTPYEKARVEASSKDTSSLTFFPRLPGEE